LSYARPGESYRPIINGCGTPFQLDAFLDSGPALPEPGFALFGGCPGVRERCPPKGSADTDRDVQTDLQPHQTTQLPGLQAAGARSTLACRPCPSHCRTNIGGRSIRANQPWARQSVPEAIPLARPCGSCSSNPAPSPFISGPAAANCRHYWQHRLARAITSVTNVHGWMDQRARRQIWRHVVGRR